MKIRKHPLYMRYMQQKYRCTNPKHVDYPLYGGRGIEFLFPSFEDWLQELGPQPTKAHTVDRIDNDGHYEPGNIRWATQTEQAFNRRKNLNTLQISGVSFLNPRGSYKVTRFVARTSEKSEHRKELYKGPDFFEACCARKSWELGAFTQKMKV